MGGLAKGLEVIRAFTRESPSLTLSEIAAFAKLPAATARRCLLTLIDLGYVLQSGRQFILRPKVLELGAAYLESMNIETVTRTCLEDLASRTGDSAALTVLDGTEIVYVARASIRSARSSASRPTSGAASPPIRPPWAACSSRDSIPRSSRTTSRRPRSCRSPIECRRAGYSAVEDELAYGVVAVAVPVRDPSGRVVAALNSSSHSKRITKTKLVRERLTMLQETSAELSSELSRVPGLALSVQS
jgi:IclR family pca regulon transcriptional regulator